MIRLPIDKQLPTLKDITKHRNYPAIKEIVAANNDAIVKSLLRKSSQKQLEILVPLLNKRYNKNEKEKFTSKTVKKWSNQAKQLNDITLEVIGIWVQKYKEKGIIILDAKLRLIQYEYYKELL